MTVTGNRYRDATVFHKVTHMLQLIAPEKSTIRPIESQWNEMKDARVSSYIYLSYFR